MAEPKEKRQQRIGYHDETAKYFLSHKSPLHPAQDKLLEVRSLLKELSVFTETMAQLHNKMLSV